MTFHTNYHSGIGLMAIAWWPAYITSVDYIYNEQKRKRREICTTILLQRIYEKFSCERNR